MKTYSVTYCDLAPLEGEPQNVVVVRVGRHWPSGVSYSIIEYDGRTMGRRMPWDGPGRTRDAEPCRVRETVYDRPGE